MNAVEQRLQAHPENAATDIHLLGTAIEHLYDASQSCTVCSDACLAEDDHDRLLGVVRLGQDCADVCLATGRMLSRQHKPNWELLRGALELAARTLDAAGSEANRHAPAYESCRRMMEDCNAAQGACNELLIRLRH